MADEQDLDLPNQGGDLALHAEMRAGELVLRYWPWLVGAVVVVVLGIFGWSQWNTWRIDGQRATTSSIADVEAGLPEDIVTLAQAQAGLRPDVTVDAAKVSEAAGKIVDIAGTGTGTAAVEGYLKAAELYRIAGDAEKRRAALDAASGIADGVLKYAAVAALANLDLEQGKADEGLARFESLRADADAFLARQATLDLAGALEALGRHADAVKAYDDYLAKWPNASDVEDVRAARQKAVDAAG